MRLDIRLPIGLLFSILGLMLALFGAFGPKDVYAHSLGYNVNLIWGVVLLGFGIIMLLLGRKGTSTAHLASEEPEGRAIEQIERRSGEESAGPAGR